MLDPLFRDLRVGARSLRRAPGFSFFAILTFAVAIGGITVIATLVNALLLRPLPYPDADRLVAVLEVDAGRRDGGFSIAAPNYLDWERESRSFTRMAMYEYLSYNLSGDGEPEQVAGLRVTHGLFETLGQPPILGRGFIPADDQGRRGNVVVLSHRLWQRRFGGDSGIVGRSIRINKTPYQVIGVMGRGFSFPTTSQELWVPIALTENDLQRASHSFWAIARLRDGVPFERASAELRGIGDRLAREYPADNRGETANVIPLHELWTGDAARTLRILMVAVALVAVIAVANVASLLVARGIARRREMAARLALGGTRGRLARQLVTESVLLAAIGAVAGASLALVAIPALVAALPPGLRNLPFRDLAAIGVDPVVLGLVILASLGIGVAAGVIPALAVLPRAPGEVLKEAEAKGATARRGSRLRNALVAVEVALAMMVLVGAGLLVASIRREIGVDPGLDPTNVVALSLALPQPDFYGEPTRPDFCVQLTDRGAAVPGVVSVSAVSHLPLSGAGASRGFSIDGAPDPGEGDNPNASYGVSCPGYFATMGIPLLAGRDFTAGDRVGAAPVAIVNQALVDRYFAGSGGAVGSRIKYGRHDSDAPWMTIVGVAGNVHHFGRADQVPPYLYRPYGQTVWPSMAVVARARANPAALVEPLRDVLSAVAPDEPIGTPIAMADIVERSLGPRRFPMVMFSLFGAVAVILAAVGIFGVASQSVVQRTRELGIRRAVGATASHLYGLVVWQAMIPVAIGIGIGIAGGLAGARVLESLLFGVGPTDLVTYGVVSLSLASIAILACLIPARRAARIDPMVALRQ